MSDLPEGIDFMSFRPLPPGLSEPPRPDPVCAVIARPTVAEALSDLSEACKRKVSMAEIRLDLIRDAGDVQAGDPVRITLARGALDATVTARTTDRPPLNRE